MIYWIEITVSYFFIELKMFWLEYILKYHFYTIRPSSIISLRSLISASSWL